MRVTYNLSGDDFKDDIFFMDEAVGRLAQVKDSPVAFFMERVVATLVMSQEQHECEDCRSNIEELADSYSAGLMKIMEQLKG